MTVNLLDLIGKYKFSKTHLLLVPHTSTTKNGHLGACVRLKTLQRKSTWSQQTSHEIELLDCSVMLRKADQHTEIIDCAIGSSRGFRLVF